MNVVALDLGTSTGFCANNGSAFVIGSWQLATAKEIKGWGQTRLNRRRDPRPQRLCQKVLGLLFVPDILIFEDCQFSSTTYQTQLWSSLRTSLWMCLGDSTLFECLPVGTLKKYATGSGNATKDQMKIAFDREVIAGEYNHDAIDAYFLHKWAKQHIRIK